jgi:hypothetical protein
MLSYLELVREEIKQHTFRPRQYAVLEYLYQGTTGWRQVLIFRLLHRFSDPQYLDAQQADAGKPLGEPERQELLRLLEEEIASVQEEFEYAEKLNEEEAALERDACLAPEGETWAMMLHREAALDRSIDRKVKILLAMRKEFPTGDLPALPEDLGDDAEMESINKILGMGIPSEAVATEGTQQIQK